MKPLIIGLTGGIASGKSTVSRQLAKLGAKIIDADKIAHELAEPGGAIYQAYVRHWGRSILTEGEKLDRAAIADLVFSNPVERDWLNNTAHPLIKAQVRQEIAAGLEQPQLKAIVLDVPLLFEAGWDTLADETWLVAVNEVVQLARIRKRDGCTEAEAQARVAAQMPLAEKMARADFVIDNSGTSAETRKKVRILWKERVGLHGNIF